MTQNNRKQAIRDLARLSQEMGVYDEFIEMGEEEEPGSEEYSSWVPFEGVLTLVDVPSDKAPSGSRGHRVVMTKTAAEAALPSFLGMAVNFRPDWDGHESRIKCGILTKADIVGQRLVVRGYLHGRDLNEIVKKIKQLPPGCLGMSYEITDTHVEDMRAQVWKLVRATFTGVAILQREKAAYKQTEFRLLDSTNVEQGAVAASEEQPKGESE